MKESPNISEALHRARAYQRIAEAQLAVGDMTAALQTLKLAEATAARR